MRSVRSILLTGGAGFIGSALARHLLAREDLESLIVLDKLTGAGRRGNLSGPDCDSRFTFAQGDIADRELVTDLLRRHSVTGVFNLAVAGPADRSPAATEDVVHTNITGTARLLDACREIGVPMLQCSTAEVYGSVEIPDAFQVGSPLDPSSPCSASKASADLLCLAACKTYRQDVVVSRCSSNYGPRQHPGELVPTLVLQALQDRPLPLRGDGMSIRDWIHVDDHCRGLLAAWEQGSRGATYLFGGRCERTDLGVARDVLKILRKPESLITFLADRPGCDRRSAIDFRRSTTQLGWRPEKRFRHSFPVVVRELAVKFQ